MFLKNSRKALKNMRARTAIFASFAVTIGVESAWAQKTATVGNFPKSNGLFIATNPFGSGQTNKSKLFRVSGRQDTMRP